MNQAVTGVIRCSCQFNPVWVNQFEEGFNLGKLKSRNIAKELDLDVPGCVEPSLEVDAPITERGQRLVRGCHERGGQIAGSFDRAHPTPPSPGGGLDQQGEPDRFRLDLERLHAIRPVERGRVERAGDDRHADRCRRPAGMELVAEPEECRGRGADEDDARRRHTLPPAPAAPTGSRIRDGWPRPRSRGRQR